MNPPSQYEHQSSSGEDVGQRPKGSSDIDDLDRANPAMGTARHNSLTSTASGVSYIPMNHRISSASGISTASGVSRTPMNHRISTASGASRRPPRTSTSDRGMSTAKAAALISAVSLGPQQLQAQAAARRSTVRGSKMSTANRTSTAGGAMLARRTSAVDTKLMEMTRQNSIISKRPSVKSAVSFCDDESFRKVPTQIEFTESTSAHDGLTATASEKIRRTCKTEVGGDWEIAFDENGINPLQRIALHIIRNPKFEGAFCFIVFVNAVTMGLESEMPHASEIFSLMDLIFLIGYTCEFALRLFALRGVLFRVAVAANTLDIVIVLAGWVAVIVEKAMENQSGDVGDQMGAINALKVLRALRVLRCVRMLTFFEGLWFVVQSFFYCLKPLIWVCIFIFVILFIFAMFAVEMLGSGQFKTIPDEDNDFTRTVTAVVTFFQLMTMDEWRNIVQPFLDEQPWTYIFFFFFIAVGSLALMNLVTAVVVENSMRRIQDDEGYRAMMADRDRVLEKEKIQTLLKFFGMDESEMGGDKKDLEQFTVGPSELLNSRGAWSILDNILEALELYTEQDIRHLFNILDVDQDGELSLTEIMDGILQLRMVIQDKYKAALIKSFKDESKFEMLGRFCEHLPEACTRRLQVVEKKIDEIEEEMERHGLTPPEEERVESTDNLQENDDPFGMTCSEQSNPSSPFASPREGDEASGKRKRKNRLGNKKKGTITDRRHSAHDTVDGDSTSLGLGRLLESLDSSHVIEEETASQAMGSTMLPGVGTGSASVASTTPFRIGDRRKYGSCSADMEAFSGNSRSLPPKLPEIPDQDELDLLLQNVPEPLGSPPTLHQNEQPRRGVEYDLLEEFRQLRKDVSKELSKNAGEIRKQNAKLSWQQGAVDNLRASLQKAIISGGTGVDDEDSEEESV